MNNSQWVRTRLPDACALIVDEAHKLPETARQMFGVTLAAEDIRALTHSLRGERFLLAAEVLTDSAAPLMRKLAHPPEGRPFDHYAKSLAAPERSLTVIKPTAPRHAHACHPQTAEECFLHCFPVPPGPPGYGLLHRGGYPRRHHAVRHHCRSDRPAPPKALAAGTAHVLTSATLAVGEDFRRFKEETGLLTDSLVTESVAPSPFDYRQNCLLYLPQTPPRQKDAAYYDELAKEIAALLDAAQGHALALFTSYAAMSAVKERLPDHGLRYPLFTMGRSAMHTTEQFKASPGSVLLAAGAAWEGFDFPGDCVSLLIIPRLPFAVPDALKEKEKENHPTLRLFIRAVVVPEMPVTGSLEDVARFIRQVKGADYFREASA